MRKYPLWQLRDEYEGAPLDPAACAAEPLTEVRSWLQRAIDAELPSPNAMTLATVDDRGRPAARIVLLKEIDDRGIVFYTNYESRKGRDLAAHPWAAAVLYWEPMHRQVRIEGAVERVSAEASDAYFASRPRGSQVGAIVSPQSQPIADRKILEARVAELTARHADGALARPAYWGGYRIVPDQIELWQGQPSRLHDRVRYRLLDAGWVRDRLAP